MITSLAALKLLLVPSQYVRDCLEVLRYGAALELGARVRRVKMDDWKYIYVEDSLNGTEPDPSTLAKPAFALKAPGDRDLSYDLPKKRGVDWEPHLQLDAPPRYIQYKDQADVCDD